MQKVPVGLDEVPFCAHPGTLGREARDPTVTRAAPRRDRRPARWGDATRGRVLLAAVVLTGCAGTASPPVAAPVVATSAAPAATPAAPLTADQARTLASLRVLDDGTRSTR